MFNTRKFNYMFLAFPVFLTGCDSDELKAVKESINYGIDSSISTNQAFKTRTDCINGQWGEAEDNRGRKVVTYTCELPEDVVKTMVSNLKITPFNAEDSNFSSKERKSVKDSFSKTIAELNSQAESINSSLPRYRELFNKIVGVFKNNPYALSNLSFSPIVGQITYKFQSDYREWLPNDKSFIRGRHKDSYPFELSFDEEKVAPLLTEASSIFNEGIRDLPKLRMIRCKDNETSQSYKSASNVEETLQDVTDSEWAKFETGVRCYTTDLTKKAQDESERLTQVDPAFDNNIARMTEFRNKFLLKKITIINKWYVSEHGGVNPANGTIAYESANNVITLSYNPEQLLAIAYKDFKPGSYPSFYEKDLYSSMVEASRQASSKMISY